MFIKFEYAGDETIDKWFLANIKNQATSSKTLPMTISLVRKSFIMMNGLKRPQ